MIRCIAIDDEPLALELINVFSAQIPFIKLEASFTDVNDAKKYLEDHVVDLLFLDIQMPSMSGIDFYKSLEKQAMVVFTTAYREYAIEGFELSAIDYLLKPFDMVRFKQAAQKAFEYNQFIKYADQGESKFLYVRSEYSLVKINLTDVWYIESYDDYIKIHQQGKKPILTLMSMKAVMEKLPPKEFVRVHRSFVVPISRIESVRGKSIMTGAVEIPIGQKYEADFFKRYTTQNFY